MSYRYEGHPVGWSDAPLAQVAHINPPGSATVVPDDQDVTFLPMAAVEELTGKISTTTNKRFGEVKKGFTRFREGDVLFAKITPCMENGKVAVARGLLGGVGCGSTEFHVLRPKEGTHADYLRYFLVRLAYRREAQLNMQGAVGQQRVPPDFLRESSIPLPPPAEQQRIVARIEELFSEIDEGERALQRVQELVERYRRSVLKAAVTGELTQNWRRQQPHETGSGNQLLAEIQRLRRAALGKIASEPSVPAHASVPGLEELPEGWCWASVDNLTTLVTSGSRGWKNHYAKAGAIFIRAQNIKYDRLDLEEVAFVNLNGVSDGLRTKVARDDILITITGANVTKSARVETDMPDAYVSQHVALVRPALPALARYLYYWLISPANGRAQLMDAAYGAGKPGLSLEDLRSVIVPLPPLNEQRQIAEILDLELSRLGALSGQCKTGKGAAAGLREAVLKHAFSGQLVAQEHTDKPASAPLARVAEQAAGSGTVSRRRPRVAPRQ